MLDMETNVMSNWGREVNEIMNYIIAAWNIDRKTKKDKTFYSKIATLMKNKNIDIQTISACTGLSIEEIEKI